jgi:hypothetical protein
LKLLKEIHPVLLTNLEIVSQGMEYSLVSLISFSDMTGIQTNSCSTPNQRFVDILDSKLSTFSDFLKTTGSRSNGVDVTTYCWKYRKLIIDVIDQECCFTADGKNIIFEFDNDVIEEVVDDVLREIDCVIIGL